MRFTTVFLGGTVLRGWLDLRGRSYKSPLPPEESRSGLIKSRGRANVTRAIPFLAVVHLSALPFGNLTLVGYA